MNGYPNSMSMFPQSPYMNPTQGVNEIRWVQGIEGAKAYSLQPNSNVQLLDSENDGIFYIKTSDNIGMCNLRVFQYTEITDNANITKSQNLSEYVRKDELENLIKSYLGGTVENEQPIPTTKPTRKPLITQ